jgi:hypothetical protein
VISPPVCAGCGKQLRTLSRLGQDWYCGGCARRDSRCSACGRQALITSRDREGQPRCARCPDRDDRDPLAVLAAAITAADPSLTADTVTAATQRVFSKTANLRKLAWAIEGNPGLLTGDGARAPVMGVLRLIDELAGAGAENITRPACGRCHRVMQLYRRLDGLWCCRNCVAKTRTQPCARCGTMREPAARDEHGQPICPNCLVSDPANLEECAQCGRKRRVSVRTEDGPLCPSCRPWQTLTCSICGREAPCAISKATGKPWCRACKQRWTRCARCGTMAPVRGGTADAPLCSACTIPGAEFCRTCPGCGQEGRIAVGQCRTCRLREQLRDLLAGPDGTINPNLQALHDSLAGSERPSTALDWLGKSTAGILREIATGQRPLTHAALDELPDSKPLRHLRTILVATGTLPPRDEQLARLETWISRAVAERPALDERRLLHRYATWHVVRRLRGRLAGKHTTYGQFLAAQRNVRAAIALLDWLTARGLTLANARQGDLDAWLGDAQATHRTDAGNFVRWARRNKLTTLDFAAVKWGGPSSVIDTETRWEQARWLLHDDTLKPGDRLAGLLVLLYAQQTSVISRLTLGHVHDADGQVLIRLGREPVVLPAPLDALARQVTATRRGHAVLGDDGTSAWLFPGGQPGQPISAFQLGGERGLGLPLVAGGAELGGDVVELAGVVPGCVDERGQRLLVALELSQGRGLEQVQELPPRRGLDGELGPGHGEGRGHLGPGQADGLGDAGLGHLPVIEQGQHREGVVGEGRRLPVVVLGPLLDQPGALVGPLVALLAGDEPQDPCACALAADGAPVPGPDPQLAAGAADEGDRDEVAAPIRPLGGDLPAQGNVRLGDGGLRVGAHVGVQQQRAGVECLQGDRLGGGVGHGVLLPEAAGALPDESLTGQLPPPLARQVRSRFRVRSTCRRQPAGPGP